MSHLVPRYHRPTARLMRQDYGKAEYVTPTATDAQLARQAYEVAKAAAALRETVR